MVVKRIDRWVIIANLMNSICGRMWGTRCVPEGLFLGTFMSICTYGFSRRAAHRFSHDKVSCRRIWSSLWSLIMHSTYRIVSRRRRPFDVENDNFRLRHRFREVDIYKVGFRIVIFGHFFAVPPIPIRIRIMLILPDRINFARCLLCVVTLFFSNFDT